MSSGPIERRPRTRRFVGRGILPALGLIGAIAGPAAAQDPHWVTDGFSGCRSWDPYGDAFTATSFIWIGGCIGTDKTADGPGVALLASAGGVSVIPQKVAGKDNSDFLAYNAAGSIAFESAHYGFPGPGHESERMIVATAGTRSRILDCREFRDVNGKQAPVGTCDNQTLRNDPLFVTTTAIDEEVWTSLAPARLNDAAAAALARGWTFGAALVFIKVIEFHPDGPEARAAREALRHIVETDAKAVALAERLHRIVNTGISL
jgi:hypothetical protein